MNFEISKKIKIGLYFLTGAIFFILAVFFFEQFPSRAFAFGAKIGGQDIGGLSKEEARAKLEKKINEFYQKEILFSYTNGKKIISKTIKINDLGVSLNAKESLEEPYLAGKNEAFFKNLKAKVKILREKSNFPLVLKISEKKFDEFITENFGEYERLPQNAEIIFDEAALIFKVQKSKNGSAFNRKEIKESLKKSSQNLNINNIYLSLKKTLPEIQEKEAKKAASKAEKIINSGPYTIVIGEETFVIENRILGTWFSFAPKKNLKETLKIYLDEELSGNYLTELSLDINIEPKNPTLMFENGKIKLISDGKNGKSLNIKEGLKKLQEEILAKKTTITLPFKEKKPSINADKIKELKINKLIGKGESNFWGSPSNRIHNIKNGVLKFAGVLIAPNEEFSFNKTLGDVNAAQGYLPELVIKNNKTIPEYGGGICQVSTTIFRVAINSGMKILERHNHAYPVGYYNPQGFDATIYLPSPDLKFKNNTGGYVLIQPKINGNTLTFEFYGKDDKRKIVVSGPYQYDFKSDGSMKARLEQELWINGKLIFKDTFLSFYKSPNLYPHPLTEEEKRKKEEEDAKKKAEKEKKEGDKKKQTN